MTRNNSWQDKVAIVTGGSSGIGKATALVKWSCFLGQVCGLAKMHQICVHAAFRISAWSKYAAFGVRLSRAV